MLVESLAVGLLTTAAWAAVPAELSSDAKAYWERGLNCEQVSESYDVSILVSNVNTAVKEVDAAMTAAGAIRTGRGYNANRQYDNIQGLMDGNPYQQGRYLFPRKMGETAAKKVWELGELSKYSVSRQDGGSVIRAIRERIDVLESELAGNEVALRKMPSARLFVHGRLEQLKLQLKGCEESLDRSLVTILLLGQPDSKKSNSR